MRQRKHIGAGVPAMVAALALAAPATAQPAAANPAAAQVASGQTRKPDILVIWGDDIGEAVMKRFVSALLLDEVLLGGGNAEKLTPIPMGCRMGDNANAFLGGFRLWEGVRK